MNDLVRILLPTILLIAGALLVMLLGLAPGRSMRRSLAPTALFVIILTVVLTALTQGDTSLAPYKDGSLHFTSTSLFITLITLAIASLMSGCNKQLRFQ